MKYLPSLIFSSLVFTFLFFLTTVFIVDEGQQALLLRLGKLEKDAKGKVQIFNPGLHLKLPVIESVRYFDIRLRTLDISSSRIVTAEKKDVIVDYYVKWRIENLPQYFISTGGNTQIAETLLQQQVNDSLRAQFGRKTINEVVTDDRSKIMDALLSQSNRGAKSFGLTVNDVRIKRIDLPQEVSNAVFNRMRAERERAATEFRSKGQASALAVRADADANVVLILAKARADAAAIRAKGLAEAAQIYANAFGKNPNFYALYRSLNVYQNVFTNKNDVFILKPHSEFLKYFDNPANTNADSGKKAHD